MAPYAGTDRIRFKGFFSACAPLPQVAQVDEQVGADGPPQTIEGVGRPDAGELQVDRRHGQAERGHQLGPFAAVEAAHHGAAQQHHRTARQRGQKYVQLI